MNRNRIAKVLAGTVMLSALFSLCACGKEVTVQTPESSEPVNEVVAEEMQEESVDLPLTVETSGPNNKQVVVYFANWNLDDKEALKGGEVAGIPWESVTYINHAFWEVLPADGSTETSFERKDEGLLARTSFKIAPTNEAADLLDEEASEIIPEIKRNHFSEYEYFSKLYPDVNIMISVGGWSDCGFFSEMAYTEEGRQSFADSCVKLMEEYPFISGIDIDWEYPAGSNDGQRYPEGGDDEGCPIFGTPEEDRINCALLFKCLRETFDEKFGEGEKKITACASASTGWTLPNQDWVSCEPYLDMLNIMTYDLAGLWDGVTGLATGMGGAKNAALYLKVAGMPSSKLCIGSPLYGTVWKMKENAVLGINAAAEDYAPNDFELTEKEILDFQNKAVEKGTPGWHYTFHKSQGAAFIYNDDPSSEYYRWFISYENEDTLNLKLDYILDNGLAGIIVWECSEDTDDYSMIKLMGERLK